MMPGTQDATKKSPRWEQIGCASPMDEGQLPETMLAMAHLGLLQ